MKWYKIKPLGSQNLVYDVSGFGTGDHTDIQIHEDKNSDNQIFKFRSTSWGTYTIHPKHCSNMVLDVEGGGDEHGTPVVLYTQHISNYENNFSRNLNQEFDLQRLGGNLYKIYNRGSGLSLGFDHQGKIRQFFDMSNSTVVELLEIDL
jgi:hypothetical protein